MKRWTCTDPDCEWANLGQTAQFQYMQEIIESRGNCLVPLLLHGFPDLFKSNNMQEALTGTQPPGAPQELQTLVHVAVGHYWAKNPLRWNDETDMGCSPNICILSRIAHENLYTELKEVYRKIELRDALWGMFVANSGASWSRIIADKTGQHGLADFGRGLHLELHHQYMVAQAQNDDDPESARRVIQMMIHGDDVPF